MQTQPQGRISKRKGCSVTCSASRHQLMCVWVSGGGAPRRRGGVFFHKTTTARNDSTRSASCGLKRIDQLFAGILWYAYQLENKCKTGECYPWADNLRSEPKSKSTIDTSTPPTMMLARQIWTRHAWTLHKTEVITQRTLFKQSTPRTVQQQKKGLWKLVAKSVIPQESLQRYSACYLMICVHTKWTCHDQ